MRGGNIEVSGTVFAPPGKTIEGTYINFCPVINNAIDCNSAQTKEVQIALNQKTASADYGFSLRAGQWVVYADKEVDGNVKFLSNEDYSGCYGAQDNTCLIVEASKNKVYSQRAQIEEKSSLRATNGSEAIQHTDAANELARRSGLLRFALNDGH